MDVAALDAAMIAAKKEVTKPSLIRMKSVIAWPAPKARGTAASHGSALGEDEIKQTKIELGLNPDEHFAMPAEVLAHTRLVKDRGAQARTAWNIKFEQWKSSNPDKASLLTLSLIHI